MVPAVTKRCQQNSPSSAAGWRADCSPGSSGDAATRSILFERRSDPRAGNTVGGRSINLALSTRGIHALQQLGIAEEVMRHAIPMRGRMIHDKSGALHFSPYDRDPAKCINSIGRGALNTAVIEAAQRHPNVRVQFNHRCVGVDLEEPAAQLVHTQTNETLRAGGDAIIGVDGAFSAVRASMQRLDRFEYSQSYLAHGYKELTIPPDGRRRLANGKTRAPHLAAQEFHDDRAAQSRRLVYLHALLGIRRSAQLCHHQVARRFPPLRRGGISRRRSAHADFAGRLSRKSRPAHS